MNEKTTDITTLQASVDSAIARCAPAMLAALPVLTQAVELARGLTELKKAFTPELMKHVFMPLQGSPLGFTTDKDKEGGYDEPTVRDCLVQAALMGLRPIGNELCIISGRAYAGKSGVDRLVREWPGLSCLNIQLSTPQPGGDKSAYVEARATWLLNGCKCEYVRGMIKQPDGSAFDTRLCIRVNAGMGPDAIAGKAHRKVCKGIYDILTNGTITLDDGEIIDTIGTAADQPQSPEGKRMKLGEKPMREPGDD